MSVDLIRYDLLVQDAMRAVVRRVLTDVARDGLPGDHHLYVSFDTRAPGVRLSPRLKERYPEEMTIVLQHQFWDLLITDVFFEVGLSFNGIPERLHVPFEALKGFFDPSVKFGLQFEPPEAEVDGDETDAPSADANVVTSLAAARPQEVRPAETGPKAAPPTSVPSTRPAAKETPKDAKPPAKPQPRPAPVAAGEAPSTGVKSGPAKPDLAKSDTAKSDTPKLDAAQAKPAEPAKDESAAGGKDGGAQVVRLDAFRKK